MAIRFRYLASDGREVDVATAGELARRLAAGELTEETLVFDAARDGWAPLRSHEVFLSGMGPVLTEGAGTVSGAGPLGLPDLRFTLQDDVGVPSTEDQVAALLRQRDDRRDREPLFPDVHDLAALATEGPPEVVPAGGPVTPATELGTSGGAPLRWDAAAQGIGPSRGGVTVTSPPLRPLPDAVPERAETTLRPAGRESTPPVVTMRDAAARARTSGPRPRLHAGPPPGRPAPAHQARRSLRALSAIGGGLVVTAVVLIGFVLVGDGGAGAVAHPPTEALSPAPPAPAAPGLPARLTAMESEALADMLLGMDSLRVAFDVERVPAVWLEGAYLAAADEHPEVRYFWERYRTYVEQVRALEPELFRRHFVARLEEENVTGPMVSIRLARALRLFEARRPQREAVYLSMMELSNASLDLHDLLVEHAPEIAYEPVSAGFSREPVVEAVALTPELTEAMNRMLDRIFSAIEGVYGERIAPRDELAGALATGLASHGG